MSLETTATHINGLEAKKMLKANLCDRIDKIKYLSQGSAFPRFKAEYAVVITAYPADIPVPEAEFVIAINSPEITNAYIQEHLSEIEVLEAKRARMVEGIARLDKILDVVRPVTIIEETLDAGNIPDELRIREGMPIPMIKTENGRRSEVYVDAKDIGK